MIDEDQGFIPGVSPLKTLRERLGNISQEDLASVFGVRALTISRWERGATEAQLTLKQVKVLLRLYEEAGFKWQDLPETFGPLPE